MKKTRKQTDWMDDAISAFVADDAAKDVSQFAGWANEVKEAVSLANKEISYVAGTYRNNDVPSLAGFYAEAAHSGSFNINAAMRGSGYRTNVPHSHEAGSSDIDTNWGQKYSSKYYGHADKSFEAQSETMKGPGHTNAIQLGKERLIPSDQLGDAHKEAARRIAKESLTRPEVAERLKETNDRLTDRVKGPDGTTSDPLTKKDADDWARDVKKGDVNTFERPQQVNVMAHIKEIGTAAGSAAMVSVALQSAPVVLGGLKKVMSDPEYSLSQYGLELGGWAKDNALRVGADSFIKSTVAGSLCAAVKSGTVGVPLGLMSPAALAGVAVVGVESAKAMWLWQKGELTGEQAASECFKVGMRTCASLAGKAAGQALIPIPVVGAVIGSYVATFIIDQGIDSIENSRSIQMLNVLDETFDTQRDVLVAIFNVGTDYRDMIRKYDVIITSNEFIQRQKQLHRLQLKEQSEKKTALIQGNKSIELNIRRRNDIWKKGLDS